MFVNLVWRPEAGVNRVYFVVNAGDKIGQFIPIRPTEADVLEVQQLSESTRGEKGYGSSGR